LTVFVVDDETIAFAVVEEFNRTCFHELIISIFIIKLSGKDKSLFCKNNFFISKMYNYY